MNKKQSKSKFKLISVKEFEERTHFIQVPTQVAKNTEISIQARHLYTILQSYCWDKDYCFPSQNTLATDMGISDRRVRTLLKELEKNRCIRIHKTGCHSPNISQLLIHPHNKKYRERYVDVFEYKKTSND
jgi:hypothetical protein